MLPPAAQVARALCLGVAIWLGIYCPPQDKPEQQERATQRLGAINNTLDSALQPAAATAPLPDIVEEDLVVELDLEEAASLVRAEDQEPASSGAAGAGGSSQAGATSGEAASSAAQPREEDLEQLVQQGIAARLIGDGKGLIAVLQRLADQLEGPASPQAAAAPGNHATLMQLSSCFTALVWQQTEACVAGRPTTLCYDFTGSGGRVWARMTGGRVGEIGRKCCWRGAGCPAATHTLFWPTLETLQLPPVLCLVVKCSPQTSCSFHVGEVPSSAVICAQICTSVAGRRWTGRCAAR